MTHLVPQNLLGNPGGDYIRDQVYARRGASGLPAMGWSTQVSALAPPMRAPVIQAGTNITITHNALGPIIASSGGGGGVSDGDKGDITVSGTGATWTVDNNAITYAKMQDVSATSRIIGRKTAGSGDPEECTLSEVLDFIGSAAQGDILYRGASAWARLGAGTSGHYLQTQGAGANPQWAAASGGSSGPTLIASATLGTAGTTLTIATSSFDLSTSKRLRIVVKAKNNTASHAGYVQIYLNTDTTASNYKSQLGALQGGSTSTARSASPDFAYMYASSSFGSEMTLFLDTDGKARINHFGPNYDFTNTTVHFGTIYYTTAVNITGLSIVAPTNMTVGSTVEVWSW